MALNKYTDIGRDYTKADGGFQFEFRCARCGDCWKSPLQPYQRGRLVGWMFDLNYLVGGMRPLERISRRLAESGAEQAREEALAKARELASAQYAECSTCHKAFCAHCFNADAGQCVDCLAADHGGQTRAAQANPGARGPACPNCGVVNQGGRFCPECGFDMAATHKSCPGCGAMAQRNARFCGECGHGF